MYFHVAGGNLFHHYKSFSFQEDKLMLSPIQNQAMSAVMDIEDRISAIYVNVDYKKISANC